MDASISGITIADTSLEGMPLTYINQAFAHITGYDVDAVLGRNCRFLQGEDRLQPELDVLREALNAGRSCRVTLRNYRRDGTLFINELSMSPIYGRDGQLTHFVGIQNDVTELHQARQALIQKQIVLESTVRELRETQMMLVHAERMNALGQMVAGIAHEINNPLSFVTSNLHSLNDILRNVFSAYDELESLVRQSPYPETKQRAGDLRVQSEIDYAVSDIDDLVRASIEGLQRMKGIVQGLRTFARLDEAEFKVASIRECVTSALMIAGGELGGRITVNLDIDDVPPIYCCPAELNQVFLNLIVNAAQSMPERGTIDILAEDSDSRIVISVKDSGLGMPPHVLTNLFTPFFTTKPAGVGVGLGLAIAHKIITERHKGTIQVQSELGKGTVFQITLPKDIRR
ncbi:MAG: PAS domain-containing protein [Pleurocapsa minor GSE-CHR-MK-17-07R]|nr:PAS domain-containing protein [Pleurocapsa minor GSE-CHR-MK 17-07R]